MANSPSDASGDSNISSGDQSDDVRMPIGRLILPTGRRNAPRRRNNRNRRGRNNRYPPVRPPHSARTLEPLPLGRDDRLQVRRAGRTVIGQPDENHAYILKLMPAGTIVFLDTENGEHLSPHTPAVSLLPADPARPNVLEHRVIARVMGSSVKSLTHPPQYIEGHPQPRRISCRSGMFAYTL